MNPLRPAVAILLGIAATAAIGLAALRSASQLWASLMYTVALGTLTVSVLASVYRRGRRRAFWVGFSACGWTYVVLCFAPWFETTVGASLVTTAALDFLYARFRPAASSGMNESTFWLTADGVGAITGPDSTAPSDLWLDDGWATGTEGKLWSTVVLSSGRYRKIGHSMFALLAAFLGGSVSLWLCMANSRTGDDRLPYGDSP